jgi:hypothetical protein
VLGIEGAVPQFPRRLVLRRGHQPQPRQLPGSSAGQGAQGTPGTSPELPPGSTRRSRAFAARAVGAHAALGVRGRGRRVHQWSPAPWRRSGRVARRGVGGPWDGAGSAVCIRRPGCRPPVGLGGRRRAGRAPPCRRTSEDGHTHGRLSVRARVPAIRVASISSSVAVRSMRRRFSVQCTA